VKNILIRSEQELLGELRELLAKFDIPSAQLIEGGLNPSNNYLETLLELKWDNLFLRLSLELRLEVRAETIAKLAVRSQSRIPILLATVSLPESLAQKCRKEGINFIDLNGRIWIRGNGLLIDCKVPDQSARYRLEEKDVDFFSTKSCRLARVLLSHPDRIWLQSDLTKATALSQGLVSRLLNHASKLGWVDGSRGDWRLTEPNSVIDAWVKADDWRKRVTLRQYSTYEADLKSLSQRILGGVSGEIAFTQWFAANLRFPYTQPPLVSAYRRHLPTPEEQAALGLREVSDGGRLWIIVPRDEGVFQTVRRVDGVPIVCDVQIYLDLLQVGLRGPDQAKALREWEGFCKP
jgi:hypothetical protein